MFGKFFSVFRHRVKAAKADNAEIIAEYVFTATLDPRTPLKVLRQHGMVLPSLPPSDERAFERDGIWLPKTKSWAELGLNLREMPPSTMASAIGQVIEDGGIFLPFLLAFRAAIEAGGAPDEVAARAWAAVQISGPWRIVASKLGWTGPDSLDEYVGYLFGKNPSPD